MSDLLILAALWLAWAALHSGMASPGVKERLRRVLGGGRQARVFYNLVSVVTLLPPAGLLIELWDSQGVAGAALVTWPIWLLPAKVTLWIAAGTLLFLTTRRYDMVAFLGFRDENGSVLVTQGSLRLVRHPWYLAGLIVLWARDLTVADLVTNAILSVYLVVGAALEERKLVAVFGEEYRRYQREVPMILPLKRPRRG